MNIDFEIPRIDCGNFLIQCISCLYDLRENKGVLMHFATMSDMGFTAHQHKKAISRRIRYEIYVQSLQ